MFKRARILLRRPVTWGVLVVLAAGLVAGLWLFQPWKLFVDRTVDETLPDVPAAASPTGTAPAPAAPVVLAAGEFITHEHTTTGSARIVRLADGRRVLGIAGLDTSNGPDLRVWLTDQEVLPGTEGWHVFDDGEYVELGRLKGNKGDQVYEIPDGVDLAAYRSVSIWCKRFAVSFGAAELVSRPAGT